MRKFLLFLIFFLPFQFALNPLPNIDLSLARILISLSFLLWLFQGLGKKSLFVAKNYLSLGLIFFLLIALVSIIKAEEISWALRKFLVFASIFPLFFVISTRLKKSDFPAIAKSLTWSSFLISFLGIFQFLSQFFWDKNAVFSFWSKYLARFFLGKSFSQAVISLPSWWVNVSGKTLLRATSLFPDPHMLAFFLGMTLPFSVFLLSQKKNTLKTRSLYGLIMFFSLVCLLLTFSRGGYLGLIASSGVFFIAAIARLNIKERLRVLLVACLIFLSLALVPPIKTRLISSFDFSEGSVAGRIQIWQEATSVWFNNFWLGVGLGNYSYYLNPLHGYRLPVYAHNTYLDIAVEIGIAALVIWILIFVYAIFKLTKISHHYTRDYSLRLAPLCLILSLTYFAAHSFFDTPIYSPRILPLLMVIFALASIFITKEKALSSLA